MTFGGGMAMLPMLEREIINKRKWATQEEMADYYAIGQCTPGIIAVNTATFIGNKCAGVLGGIVATLGLVFPSLIIITFLAAVIERFSQFAIVQSAFSGIQVAVCVLILNSMMRLRKTSVVDKLTGIIFMAVLFISVFSNISPVAFVLLSAFVGIMAKSAEWKENKISLDNFETSKKVDTRTKTKQKTAKKPNSYIGEEYGSHKESAVSSEKGGSKK